MRRLAERAAEAGAELREHHRVDSIDELEADHVVLATDGYTKGLLPELDAAVIPTRGQVLVTEPLERLLFPCPHYARHGYDYWQQTPEGRVVAGGVRDKALDHEHTSEEKVTPLIQGHVWLRQTCGAPRATRGAGRLIRAEFAAGAVGSVARVSLLLSAGGIWLVGVGINHAPRLYAQSLSRPGELEAELRGVDLRRELRRASLRQSWIPVPLAVAIAAAATELGDRERRP